MAQELDAVHARHAEVAENKIDRRAVDLVQRAHPVMGVERGGHTELLEVALEQTDDELVVVDDEDVHSRQRPAHGVARAVCQAARSRATGWMARARFHRPALALCGARSEEHTPELRSIRRVAYAAF